MNENTSLNMRQPGVCPTCGRCPTCGHLEPTVPQLPTWNPDKTNDSVRIPTPYGVNDHWKVNVAAVVAMQGFDLHNSKQKMSYDLRATCARLMADALLKELGIEEPKHEQRCGA